MRARNPDRCGTVERDDVRLGYEVFGQGDATILLLPTWTIVHARFWKMQVPYLARYYQVVTYDGPGNGRSERITDPARYTADAYAADAAAVLDACEIDRAVVVGLSLGAQYGLRLAALHPDRLAGLVLVGPALPLAPRTPEREAIVENFHKAYPEHPVGWQKYNLAYWHDHYEDFASFFFDSVFSEPHSTKAREDAVQWALETSPQVLEAEAARPALPSRWPEMIDQVGCPTLVVHGTADRIHPHLAGSEAARLTGGTLVSMDGSGHMPNLRDPVRFNLVLRDFVERVTA